LAFFTNKPTGFRLPGDGRPRWGRKGGRGEGGIITQGGGGNGWFIRVGGGGFPGGFFRAFGGPGGKMTGGEERFFFGRLPRSFAPSALMSGCRGGKKGGKENRHPRPKNFRRGAGGGQPPPAFKGRGGPRRGGAAKNLASQGGLGRRPRGGPVGARGLSQIFGPRCGLCFQKNGRAEISAPPGPHGRPTFDTKGWRQTPGGKPKKPPPGNKKPPGAGPAWASGCGARYSGRARAGKAGTLDGAGAWKNHSGWHRGEIGGNRAAGRGNLFVRKKKKKKKKKGRKHWGDSRARSSKTRQKAVAAGPGRLAGGQLLVKKNRADFPGKRGILRGKQPRPRGGGLGK